MTVGRIGAGAVQRENTQATGTQIGSLFATTATGNQMMNIAGGGGLQGGEEGREEGREAGVGGGRGASVDMSWNNFDSSGDRMGEFT